MEAQLKLACAFSALMATTALAQDASSFRGEGEGDWYHPIEPASWLYWGAEEAVVNGILERVEQSDGPHRFDDQPDTQIEYGPGNWVYEFSEAGDIAMQNALIATSEDAQFTGFKAALAYYHIASAPHTNAPHARAALHKAGEAYAAAAAFLPGEFEAVDIPFAGASFTAHLHTPPGDGPFPVLIFSNGSDQSKETALNYYQTHLLPRGIAFLGLDMPGMGDSADYDLQDFISDKLHAAAVDYVRSRSDIAAKNVFVQGNSFGGNAAARIFLARPELDLGGVAFVCGPMHSAFLAPPEVYDHLPVFTMDGVRTRFGLPLEASSQDVSDRVQGMSFQVSGLFDGDPIDTPLLAINTNQDPVSPLEEMEEFLFPKATNVTPAIFDISGHCPPHSLREPIIAAWILDNLR